MAAATMRRTNAPRWGKRNTGHKKENKTMNKKTHTKKGNENNKKNTHTKGDENGKTRKRKSTTKTAVDQPQGSKQEPQHR